MVDRMPGPLDKPMNPWTSVSSSQASWHPGGLCDLETFPLVDLALVMMLFMSCLDDDSFT